MNIVKGLIGSALVISSSILFAAKYIAAVAAKSEGIWSRSEFTDALRYTPIALNVAIYGALVVGIIFIFLSLVGTGKTVKK